MKRTFRTRMILGSALLLLFTATACEETIAGPLVPNGDLTVTIVPDGAVVEVGETVQFTGSVNHQGFVLAWRSGDPAIATIDATGTARGEAPGETYVHLFVELAPHVQDSVRILVE